jgi:hypothetical protein
MVLLNPSDSFNNGGNDVLYGAQSYQDPVGIGYNGNDCVLAGVSIGRMVVDSSSDIYHEGETIDFSIRFTGVEAAKSLYFNLSYDRAVAEIVGYEWLISGVIEDFNDGEGIVAWSSDKNLNSAVFKLSLKIVGDADEFTVSCDSIVNPGSLSFNAEKTVVKQTVLIGDLDEDGEVTSDDAVYLQYSTLFPDKYHLNQDVDFNDAIYLLYFTFFPDKYPLHPNKDCYYFFINYGDSNPKTGWYTATGKNIDDALAAAVKDKGITITYSKYGYPNFDGGTWGVFSYSWDLCNSTAAEESIKSPNYGVYNDFIKSNGWDSFAGYGDNSAKKMNQSGSNVFYFAKYEEDYSIKDPTQSKLWMTATGSPFVKGVSFAKEFTLYFYINYGDNNAKTGWYSAKGSNADDALAAAIKDKGITLSYSKYGYPNFDGGTWGTFTYNWFDCNKATAEASVSAPNYGVYKDFIKSNGWDAFSGFGSDAKKLYQSVSLVFYFAQYDESYDLKDPTESQLWMTATGSPFAA